MVTAGDFRNGVTFEMDGQVYQIVEFQHVKPGKGAAFVRAKIKNVIQGSVVERTFNPTEKFPTAFIERKDMVYSYNDDGIYYHAVIFFPALLDHINDISLMIGLKETDFRAACLAVYFEFFIYSFQRFRTVHIFFAYSGHIEIGTVEHKYFFHC